VVDWTTLKTAHSIHIPIQRDVPWGVLKFLEGGLSIKRTQRDRLDPYVSNDSSPNSNSDGSQPMKLSNNPTAVASRRLRMRKRTRDGEQLPLLQAVDVHLDQHIASASNTASAVDTAGLSNISGTSNIVGASNIASTSNISGASSIVGTSDAAGTSNLVGANSFPAVVAL
jgi:hypothetical protein